MREVWLEVQNARHCANSLPKMVKRPYPNSHFYMIYKGNEPTSQYSGKALGVPPSPAGVPLGVLWGPPPPGCPPPVITFVGSPIFDIIGKHVNLRITHEKPYQTQGPGPHNVVLNRSKKLYGTPKASQKTANASQRPPYGPHGLPKSTQRPQNDHQRASRGS